jgi:hypothetical protein
MKTSVKTNIPTINSSPEQWEQWHKDLKSTFGKKTANSIFIAYWEKRGSGEGTKRLRDYCEKQGFKLETSGVTDFTDDTLDVFDSIGDIFKVAKIAGISLVGILVLGIGILIINVARKPIETINAARG